MGSLLLARTPAGAAPVVAPEVPVSALDERLQLSHNSPMLVVDPTRSSFVVLANRLDNPEFGCPLHLSGDGGRSWIAVKAVPRLPDGVDQCYAPEVAFDRDGLLYFLFVGLAGPGNAPVGAWLVTTGDRGRSFTEPRRVLGPERYMVRLAIEADRGTRGRIHLAWLEARTDPPLGGLPPPPNPILTAWSDDGGRTFSEPVRVSRPEQRAVAPVLRVGPGGAVHLLYHDLEDDARDYQGLEGPAWEGTWSLWLASSSDAGASFADPALVDEGIVPPERVMLVFTMPAASLAVAPSGRLYAAWTDARAGDWDVLLRASPDGGRTWDPPVRVNDDAGGNGRHQYLPAVGVAPDGRVDVVFLDRRDDPDNVRNHTWTATSLDGGATFGPNLRLTADPSDSKIGTRYDVPSALGLVEFGSRLGVVSLEGRMLAAWPDTRNGEPGEYSQDVFATEVDFDGRAPGGGDLPVVATVAGLVLALVAVGGVAGARRRRVAPMEASGVT